MNAVDIVRMAIEESGLSQKKVGEKIGLKTQQGMFNLLKAKKGMRIDNFIALMDALGYDVVVKNRVNDKEIVVERAVELEGDAE